MMIFDTIIQFLLGALAMGAVVVILLLMAKIVSWVQDRTKITAEDVGFAITISLGIFFFVVVSIIVGGAFYP